MNNLCADIGWKSINHEGEELCGDHVEIIERDEDSIIVLADGLGSGVKASILSTLTSKILSTMMANDIPLEECVSTIAATLPICKVRGLAYSTFTIIHIIDNAVAELIQFDNPHIILIRDCEICEYPENEVTIDNKKIYKSTIKLQENDIFIAMSDGCPHAGIGRVFNFGWKREDIAEYMKTFAHVGYTAKTLSTMLVDECNRQYDFGRRANPTTFPRQYALWTTAKPRRRRPYDVALLLKRGKTHRLRRHYVVDRRPIPRQTPTRQPLLRTQRYPTHGRNRRRRPRHRRRHHREQSPRIRA